MSKLQFLINNNGTMEMTQNKNDGNVTIHTFYDSKSYTDTENDMNINAGDMIMLINYYSHIKNNDIQNDFINPNGRNKE